jgi:hypothetical protein
LEFLFAVPVFILLLALVLLALVLHLQRSSAAERVGNGKNKLPPGGSKFIEDEEGHQVRRSQRCGLFAPCEVATMPAQFGF